MPAGANTIFPDVHAAHVPVLASSLRCQACPFKTAGHSCNHSTHDAKIALLHPAFERRCWIVVVIHWCSKALDAGVFSAARLIPSNAARLIPSNVGCAGHSCTVPVAATQLGLPSHSSGCWHMMLVAVWLAVADTYQLHCCMGLGCTPGESCFTIPMYAATPTPGNNCYVRQLMLLHDYYVWQQCNRCLTICYEWQQSVRCFITTVYGS